MGLGIVAYSELIEATGNEAFDETGEIKDDWFQININDWGYGQSDGLHDRHAYRAKDSRHFHAGSYGYYNQWRDQLAELAGYKQDTYISFGGSEVESFAATVWHNMGPGPFAELICFSDCDGIIGPKTSAKLANDFAEFQEKADQHEDENFRHLYSEWRKAFEMAANNGAVRFC